MKILTIVGARPQFIKAVAAMGYDREDARIIGRFDVGRKTGYHTGL